MTPNDWKILARHGVTPDNLSVGGALSLYGCTWLTGLPDNLSVGGALSLYGCTGLGEALYFDPRGYELRPALGGYVSGCRRFRTAADAIAHWGADDYPDQERGAAYVAAIRKHMEAAQ